MKFSEHVSGGRIVGDIAGRGRGTIILVHGFGCDASDWEAQVAALQTRYRVIAYDLPGHGGSSPPPKVGIDHLVQSLGDLRRRFAADPCILVGHSMGCRMVLEAYSRDPAGVAGIVLVDGSRIGETGDQDQLGVVRSLIEAKGGRSILDELYAGMIMEDGAFKARATRRLADISADGVEDMLLSLAAWDKERAAHVLRGIRVPLLLVQSTYLDLTVGRRSLEHGRDSPWLSFVAEHAPHATVEIVTGTLHFPHVEKPREVNAAIERFAGETFASRAGAS